MVENVWGTLKRSISPRIVEVLLARGFGMVKG